MAELNLETADTQRVGQDIRALAENMLLEIEKGDISGAVALVGELNEVRDRALYNEIGRLTRALHEAIKNLHVDGGTGASSEIANATDKLTYVLEMTDKSANRTMDLVDESMLVVNELHQQADTLSAQWKRFLKKEIKPDEFRQLSKDVGQYLQHSAKSTERLKGQLNDIVLAQDFQDLTGQVIHKVAALVRDVELRLVQLVMMAGQVDKITGITHNVEQEQLSSEIERNDIVAEGPQINKNSENVVASQDDVDDLLSSLGF